MPSFRLSVLGFAVCFPSPFPASLPQLFHRCLPSAFFRPLSVFSSSGPLSFVRFPSVSGYSAFCFFLSVLFTALPHSGFSVAPSLLSLLRFSLSVPPGFPCFSFSSRTWLSVGFLSSFPVSLPQLFHWCSPFSFPPAFVLCFTFFRPLCFRLLTTQLSALSFPFFPFSLAAVPSVLICIRFPFVCCHTPVPLWYSASCSSFLRFPFSPRSGYFSVPSLCLSTLAFPLRFPLRFWILSLGDVP